MANYYCDIRSNYFKAKDPLELKQLLLACGLEVWETEDGYMGFGGQDLAGFGTYFDEDDEEYDIYEEIQKQLKSGEACIILEIGSEKLRYLIGCSTIITKNEIRYVHLTDVTMEVLKEMMPHASERNKKIEY